MGDYGDPVRIVTVPAPIEVPGPVPTPDKVEAPV